MDIMNWLLGVIVSHGWFIDGAVTVHEHFHHIVKQF